MDLLELFYVYVPAFHRRVFLYWESTEREECLVFA